MAKIPINVSNYKANSDQVILLNDRNWVQQNNVNRQNFIIINNVHAESWWLKSGLKIEM